jgi:branched-chain amino acid transport system ATP-binding protein
MTDALLTVAGLSKRFGGFLALSDIQLQVVEGERLGLIGPNGSGKSTLVNCLCGTLHNDAGQVTFSGQELNGLSAHQRTRLGLARSFQLPRPFPTLTLAENVRVPILYAADVKAGRIVKDPRQRCEELLDMVGLLPKADRKPADLTQIEMRKLELARAMASEPRLLIADEAMAGLSHQEVDDILALLMKMNTSCARCWRFLNALWCWSRGARLPMAIRRT